MKLEIMAERDNPLLGRKELDFKVSGTKTVPSRKELVKKIVAMKNTKEELVVIGKMGQSFGEQSIFGQARVYNSEEMLKRAELFPIIKRHQEKKVKEKKEEEAPAKEPQAGEREKIEKKEAGEEAGKEKGKEIPKEGLEKKKEEAAGEEKKEISKEAKKEKGAEGEKKEEKTGEKKQE